MLETKCREIIFHGLCDVIRPRSEEDGTPEQTQRLARIPDRKGLLAEALLLSDQVVFDIDGPNLEIPLLLNFFGYKRLCQLLDEDIFHFSFCPGTFAYVSQENKRALDLKASPGLHRITAVELGWSDPYESAIKALLEQTNLKRDDRRFLARLAARNTKTLPADKIFTEAVRLADADRNSSLGQELGFSVDDNPLQVDFSQEKKRKYLDLASHNLSYLCMILSHCSDLVAEELAYRVLENRVIVEPKFIDRTQILGQILEFENTPNIRTLVAQGALSLDSILEIRKSNRFKEFRKWLHTIPTDSGQLDVLKSYSAAIQAKISNSLVYKALKVAAFTGVGAAIGSIGGPVAAGVGAVATDLILNFADTFFIDEIVNGWNPKIFIEKEIKPRVVN